MDHVGCREVGLTIFARNCHLLLRVLQISILAIEPEFEAMLCLRCHPRSKRFYILIEVALNLVVLYPHCEEALGRKHEEVRLVVSSLS